jgi:D-alanine-D-alanine ligase
MYQILLACGGDGSEHSISLTSAKYLESKLNEINDIAVHKVILHRNFWETGNNEQCFLNNNNELVVENKQPVKIDYVIPCIHGFPGETGDFQSYLELLNLPYLGCPSEGSKLCFNKISTKLWLSSLEIPNTPYVFLSENNQADQAKAFQAMRKWGAVFVKAASQGSSVGCYKVTELSKLSECITEAFKYSKQVLIEKCIKPRELEVAVYEYGGKLIATNPGEILTNADTFYSYEEKYNADSKTTTAIEAQNLTDEQKEQIKQYAIKAFTQLKLKDLSRIDFFLSEDGDILLNEINTFPGMTPISMFPKMMENNGHSMVSFLEQCIRKALKK